MEQSVKEKWVAALRSGEYKQAAHELRHAGGFCCLGVLCDLYATEVGGEWLPLRTMTSYEYRFVAADGSDNETHLPTGVAVWAGLAEIPMVRTARGQDELACVNDLGTPFTAIADIIEAQL